MSKLTAWERMELIRQKERPTVRDYIPVVFDEFFEMHGDRLYGDDHAIVGGIGVLDGTPVTVIGQLKGKTIEENKHANFAMAHPEGYRKALRLMRQAEKFHRPVLCFIDTPGAFCGVEAEERGQGEAIAKNLFELMRLKTPVISVVLGEGGSGGALGLGVCDRLAMLENAVYSVISPRGCASILWKDASKEKEAANVLKITAEDLQEFGVCDDILAEPTGGAHKQPELMAQTLRDYLIHTVGVLRDWDEQELLDARYHKFRKIGEFSEE
ncbi:acetyl-CoA carboxylase carboxyltransferase subunit alpha [Zongyangia hominis]|nr:acetyl-CoA carboxylase carboxyltransferase subunit alpha [Zongyangia hominis]